ncbi:MAG: YceH family protein [Verrucomicrobia bacterium]|nr:YceH family protein [Verrucomicrobiota bacterium]
MDIELDAVETRILGCLLEKERTTPDLYPLTLNALQAACNQKSSRHPVMDLTTSQIEKALESMRYEKHTVYQVTQAGSRVPKFKHNFETVGNFSAADSAILAVLMLRGPQTAAEVKTHTERLHPFASREDVEQVLEELRTSDAGPFVVHLERERGRRERRFMHLLSGMPLDTDTGEAHDEGDEMRPHLDRATSPAPSRLDVLETEVANLRGELNRLKEALGIEDDAPATANSEDGEGIKKNPELNPNPA